MPKSTLPQKTKKLVGIYPYYPGLTCCPTNDTNARGDEEISFLIPDGQVTWWHCSACQGWHVSIVDNRRKR